MKRTEFHSAHLRERYTRLEHPSGLAIYVFPKALTTTYALFSTKYGSVDSCFVNERGETVTSPDGVAHFLEHKLFDNPDGSDSFGRFSQLGADANAYTTYNRTAYLFSCTEGFSESLEELLRFVTTPYFTDASVRKEQGIIAEEIRMYEDNPWDRGFQRLLERMYPLHPVSRNVCGSVESIGEITPQLLYDCYHAFYRLSNMVLVVCGDVTVEQVLEVADRVLPSEPARPALTSLRPKDLEPPLRHTVEERMQVSKPLFCIGFKDGTPGDTPEAPVMRPPTLRECLTET